MLQERASKRRKVSPLGEERSSVPGFAKWNLEQDYEQRARQKKRKDENNRLPIKSQESGRWEQDVSRDHQNGSAGEEDSVLTSEDEEKDSAVADLHTKPATLRPQLSPKEEIRQAKEELARIAGLISEDPEEHIGLLNSLAEFAASKNETVKKLALGTQLAVYKDIIPGYRIRPLAKDDMQAKLSKDVRKLRNYEQSLLSGYKGYTIMLSSLAAEDVDASLASVALSCTCALLASVPHFNQRNDLIAILVRRVKGRNIDTDFVKCCEALEQLFQEDEEGHASLEAVSQLTKMLKAQNYNVHERVLNTFLHLRLLGEFAHKASTNRIDKDDEQDGKAVKKAKQKREFRTKRDRKRLKEQNEVAKEMKEADAAVSFEERDRNQAETLKLVFVAYFRVLKARTSHLMGAVLEGLAKYAHLINQDFFGDVLEALKDLINEAVSSLSAAEDNDDESEHSPSSSRPKRNATRESLLSIITAFALLQGQTDVAKSANTLHLDLNFFTSHLYRTLLLLSMDADIELSARHNIHLTDPNGLDIPSTTATTKDAKVNIATTTVLLLRSLQAVLLPPTGTKQVPPVRIAAFTKQLLSCCLQLPNKSALAVLGVLQHVTKTHGTKVAALWHTEERKGDGVFNALSAQYESSNPFAATVWEGELLRHHWDPKVREAVEGLQKNVLAAR